MTSDRVHRAVSDDGTEIAGRVHGQGPPLVLFHGAPHDGDLAWEALLPRLADRFTCYLPSWRGRGRSADSEDHTPPRRELSCEGLRGRPGCGARRVLGDLRHRR
jgi:pimeloyl-ACP methyl ester carboxylesterase